MAEKKDDSKKRAVKKKAGSKKPAPKKKSGPEKRAAEAAPSAGLTELIGHALADQDFRERLFTDREALLRDYELTERDREALERLSRDELEQQAERLGGRASITIKIAITKSF
jgi:hypothetical protein